MDRRFRVSGKIIFIVIFALLVFSGCGIAVEEQYLVVDQPTLMQTSTPSKFVNAQAATRDSTMTPSTGLSSTTDVFPLELACKKPFEDYSRIEINGYQLNQRTFEILQTAQSLYGGIIDITGNAITQGSYTSAVEASFGTHAGGGVVDLSVMAPGTYTILYEDIDPLIKALRSAGFAAWYRDLDELYDGSPAHIHAVAIGDRELSLSAREQLAGPFGYFWGYNGLPTRDKKPIRDPHGGPIICDWMLEKGYPNKTATPSPDEMVP